MEGIKELTENSLDKINGGIVCPDGINRPVYYDEHVFCPNCHEREYGKIFATETTKDNHMWVYCVHCGFSLFF